MGEYLSALWGHWVGLMSGIVGLLAAIGLRIGRRVWKAVRDWPDLPDYAFVAMCVCGLFWAGYQAWSDKRDELQKSQDRLKTPELVVHLSSLITGTLGKDPLVVLGGEILNPVGPDTGTVAWRVTAKLAKGTVVGIVVPAHDRDIHAGAVVLRMQDFWPDKTERPIPSGGAASGWIAAVFRNATKADLEASDSVFAIDFRDIASGNNHHAEKQSTGDLHNEQIPGLDPLKLKRSGKGASK